MEDFETSAAYMGALSRAMDKLHVLTDVVAKAPPQVAEMLRFPLTRKWWPSSVAFGMTDAIVAVGGPELLQRIGRQAVFESMLPILRPLLAVVVAVSGSSPHVLFGRFPQFVLSSLKNVRLEYAKIGDRQGRLTITYPRPVPDVYVWYWLGSFDFVFETAKVRALPTKADHHGHVLHFELSWQ